MSQFMNKSVLVTGAGGSIGSQLCEQIVKEGASELTLLSLTEAGLYNVTRKLRALKSETDIVPILGSITDQKLVSEIMLNGQHVVIHAAAHKHVPICQDNPIEAVRNNVFGTYQLARAAVDAGVKQFLQISTDKAVKPSSIMGATKRVAELLIMKMAMQNPDTEFSIVRFGNVMDSAGSVLPLWREQLARGEQLTVTDVRCTRYFMTIPEACTLVLEALKLGTGLYVFDMGEPKNIFEMACQMVMNVGGDPEQSVKLIGLRDGEKLTEELDYGGMRCDTAHPKIFRVVENPEATHALSALHELDNYVRTRLDRRLVDTLMDMVK